MDERFIEALRQTLPLVVTRKEASKAIGELLSPKSFANLDSMGQGPSCRVKIGRKVGYPKESFIAWVVDRQSKS
jgi:hypothetical protein